MKHIFIIGSKGVPAKYGGFETFVDKLVSYKKSDDIQYYVSCLSDNSETFNYNGAICFNVNVPKVGSAKAIIYDILSLKACISFMKDKKGQDCIVYILACRIGPFMSKYKRQFEKIGVRVYINPDGHEWKRSKWNTAIKRYWKLSEKLMIKHTDLAICDSKAIEKYIIEDYKRFKPSTTYISYGADIEPSPMDTKDKKLTEWFNKYNISHNEYYLVVGRFVPENNYETIIKEFISSNTKKDLVIITNNEENGFYKLLIENTKFNEDKRVKFVGTLYDDGMLKKIREFAYGYIHGHEVGGTNPSLLEALSSTKINILFNVQFNKEVAEDGALYFSKSKGELKSIIEKADILNSNEIEHLANKAKNRIKNYYSWDYIVDTYEELWKS